VHRNPPVRRGRLDRKLGSIAEDSVRKAVQNGRNSTSLFPPSFPCAPGFLRYIPANNDIS
jgi:hypothetical protein